MESQNAAFWLPDQFLSDEDFLPDVVDKEKENDEFLTELTRHLARSSLTEKSSWNLSTSPQSTLNWLSSNGASPPLTPPGAKNDAAWDLLYEAATQVARLKMAAQMQNPTNSAFPRHHNHINSFYNTTQHVKRQGSGNTMWGHQQNTQRVNPGGFTLPHSAWPSTRPGTHQNHLNRRDMRVGPVYLGSGQPVKKPSAGTGVFIPRTFGAHPEPRKNTPVTVTGGVVSALNVDHQRMNNRFSINSSPFTPNYDILMARRNAIMNQQRKQEMPVTMVTQDVRLPTDWTY